MHTMGDLRLIYLADKEAMLVIKAGNGITGENVATIVQAMLIEAEYDDLEQKLTLPSRACTPPTTSSAT